MTIDDEEEDEEDDEDDDMEASQHLTTALIKSLPSNPPVSRSKLPFKIKILNRGPLALAMAAPMPCRIRLGAKDVYKEPML